MIDVDLPGARQAIVDRLNAAGIRATGDPGALAPIVLVAAPSLINALVGGPPTVDTDWPVVCIHPPPGNAAALDWLLTTASAVLNELGPCRVTAQPGTYGDPPQPAYTLTFTGELAVC